MNKISYKEPINWDKIYSEYDEVLKHIDVDDVNDECFNKIDDELLRYSKKMNNIPELKKANMGLNTCEFTKLFEYHFPGTLYFYITINIYKDSSQYVSIDRKPIVIENKTYPIFIKLLFFSDKMNREDHV